MAEGGIAEKVLLREVQVVQRTLVKSNSPTSDFDKERREIDLDLLLASG